MQNKSESDFENKKQFLLNNENMFLCGISLWFSLTHKQLKKYKSILKWSYIDSNHDIQWTIDLIDEFKDLLFGDSEDYSDLGFNESLPWSIELIERFEDLWRWESLAQNRNVTTIPNVLHYFYYRIYPYFDLISDSPPYDFLESDLKYMSKHKELQILTIDEIDSHENLDWDRLSQNEILPWSANLLDRYINKWNWSILSSNNSIPWDFDLIKRYQHYIDWSISRYEDGGNQIINSNGISVNNKIEWDAEIIGYFRKKLCFTNLSISQFAKWDIHLLMQFEDYWDYSILTLNRIIYNKVFPEFNDEDNLNMLLDIIMAKQNPE